MSPRSRVFTAWWSPGQMRVRELGHSVFVDDQTVIEGVRLSASLFLSLSSPPSLFVSLSASLPPCLPPSLSSVPPRLPLCLSLSASLSLSLSLSASFSPSVRARGCRSAPRYCSPSRRVVCTLSPPLSGADRSRRCIYAFTWHPFSMHTRCGTSLARRSLRCRCWTSPRPSPATTACCRSSAGTRARSRSTATRRYAPTVSAVSPLLLLLLLWALPRAAAALLATGAGGDHGIDYTQNWLRFPYDSTFLRSHHLHLHPYMLTCVLGVCVAPLRYLPTACSAGGGLRGQVLVRRRAEGSGTAHVSASIARAQLTTSARAQLTKTSDRGWCSEARRGWRRRISGWPRRAGVRGCSPAPPRLRILD
jgi:hypothetical protein